MPAGEWDRDGPEFTLAWGGRQWSLKVDGPDPGLRYQRQGLRARVLSPTALAEAGRCESGIFTAANLVETELHRARVMATFAPPGWGGLSVRAAWGIGGAPEAVDLEVQVSATSVGQLQNLEVAVESEWSKTAGARSAGAGDGAGADPDAGAGAAADLTASSLQVEPRDARSAALSYDGREPDRVLARLTTLPVCGPSLGLFRPRVVTFPPASSAGCYIEMVQPDDVARRIAYGGPPTGETAVLTRYALFGHDLEKGVVLRARLRVQWLAPAATDDDAESLWQAFLHEGPPLGP